MLNWFDYGHYAIWYFSPDLKVSIDGRRETLYSQPIIAQHLAFYFAPESRHAAIRTLAPDYIWLPSRLAVTTQLLNDGWKPVFRGPQSTLLASPANVLNTVQAVNGLNLATAVTPAARCFPGP